MTGLQTTSETLLDVRNLRTYFYAKKGVVKAVDDVSFAVSKSGTLGLVGESGCGKTATLMSIMRIIRPPGEIVDGTVMFQGENLLEKTEAEMNAIRGSRIAVIFQQPGTALNPVFTIGKQMKDILKLHRKVGDAAAQDAVTKILEDLNMPDPSGTLSKYPHELSGGMQQRVMIGMAISCEPSLLLADEPTTALDVSVQLQIIRLLQRIVERHGLSLLLVTHNFGIVAKLCSHVAVMYAGKIVECADTRTVFADPLHPYTQALIRMIPKITEDVQRLNSLKGEVPSLIDPPVGCRFHPRCEFATDICRKEQPPSVDVGNGHRVSCFHVLR